MVQKEVADRMVAEPGTDLQGLVRSGSVLYAAACRARCAAAFLYPGTGGGFSGHRLRCPGRAAGHGSG